MTRLSRRKLAKTGLDQILDEALRDDLPPETEVFLRTQLRETWRNARRVVPDSLPDDAESVESWLSESVDRGTWDLHRAWIGMAAVGAAVLLAVGMAEMANSGGLLAESLAIRHTCSSILAQMRQCEQMRCWLETADSSGETRRYLVEWVAGGETQIRIERPEGNIDRTVRLQRREATLLDRAQAEPGQLIGTLDPLVTPVRDFLSPDMLAGLLDGQWEAVRGASGSGVVFRIGLAAESRIVYLTIDSSTYLPAVIEVLRADLGSGVERTPSSVRARFHWKLRPAVRVGTQIERQTINFMPPEKEGGACRPTV
jgi:hypothetical protein